MNLRFARVLSFAFLMTILLGGCRREPPRDPRIAWILPFDDVVAAPPVLGDDGTIYVGSHDGRFCAVSPDGERLWTVKGGDYFHAPAALLPWGIVIGNYDHNVYGIGYDGRVLWTFGTHERVESGAAAAREGNAIYIPGLDDTLYCLDQRGQKLWDRQASDDIGGSPAVLPDGAVVVGDKSGSGILYCVEPDGALRWRRPLDTIILSSPALARDGTIIVAGLRGTLHAYTPDGERLWKRDLGARLISSPAVDGEGNLYVGDLDGFLHCLNADGEERWRYGTYTRIVSSPTLGAGGKVYFGSDSKTLHCVDTRTGKLDWKVPLEGYVSSSAVIAPDGTLYIGCDNGRLYAIRTDSRGLAPDAPWPFLRGVPSGRGWLNQQRRPARAGARS